MTTNSEINTDPHGAKYSLHRSRQLAPLRDALLRMNKEELCATWGLWEPHLRARVDAAIEIVHQCILVVRENHSPKNDLEAQIKSPELRSSLERRWDAEAIYAVFHSIYARRIFL